MEKPWILKIIPDLLGFAGGLALAYFLKWETKDLVWSLWLCSLTLGYLTLLSAIGARAYLGVHAVRHPDFERKYFWPAVLVGSFGGLFFLGFFSLHFGGFHAGHSVFLQQFFPLKGMPKDGFGQAFMNPPLLWALTFKHLMVPYGLFLIPALIAERKHVFKPLIKAVNAVRSGTQASEINLNRVREFSQKSKKAGGDIMGRPYLNVIRMHLLIFAFAFCKMAKVDSFAIYALVYAVYFFPWAEVRQLTRKDQAATEEA